jgi:glycosyltransferase involved in cell wall biosynthesis
MKLAFIVKGGLHPSGRREVMPGWLTLLERLSRRHDVHAFVTRHLDRPSTYALRGVTVHDLGSPGAHRRLGRWWEWRALRASLAECGPFDVLHGFWADPGGLAALAGRRLQTPSVVLCNSGEFSAIDDIGYGLQRTARGRALVSASCRLATRVHVTTSYMAGLARRHGIDAVRIPVGVDTTYFQPPAQRVEGPPWRLLQVASINPVKDHATLLAAFAQVAARLDARLDVVGADTLDGAAQRRAIALGIADRVAFHGFTPFDELVPFYHAAHAYVQSSRHEAAGAAVMEAAACGLAIVGTRVGYVSDWSPDAAVAVEPEDAAALSAAIEALLGDRARRHTLGINARRLAEAHDIEWTAARLDELYRSLAKHR